jgi:hypothetical protein
MACLAARFVVEAALVRFLSSVCTVILLSINSARAHQFFVDNVYYASFLLLQQMLIHISPCYGESPLASPAQWWLPWAGINVGALIHMQRQRGGHYGHVDVQLFEDESLFAYLFYRLICVSLVVHVKSENWM